MSIEAMKQALEALEVEQTVYIRANLPVPNYLTKAITSLRQAIAEAEKQVSYSGNGTAGRENMTAPTGFFFQMPKQEPIARVTGTYGGRFVVEPLNPAMVLPTNMALYAEPQPKAEKQEPVAWYYEIDGSKAISFAKDGEPNKPWQGLYTHPDPDALHAAYMSGFYDGKKSKEKNNA